MDKQTEVKLNYLATIYLEVLEASAMILQQLDREIRDKGGRGLQHRAKQRNTRILNHMTALRILTSEDTFENEHQAFSKNWLQYDDFRKDAAYFARIALLIGDRTFNDNVFMDQFEQFIKNKAEKGMIPDEIVNRLVIR